MHSIQFKIYFRSADGLADRLVDIIHDFHISSDKRFLRSQLLDRIWEEAQLFFSSKEKLLESIFYEESDQLLDFDQLLSNLLTKDNIDEVSIILLEKDTSLPTDDILVPRFIPILKDSLNSLIASEKTWSELASYCIENNITPSTIRSVPKGFKGHFLNREALAIKQEQQSSEKPTQDKVRIMVDVKFSAPMEVAEQVLKYANNLLAEYNNK